MIHLNNSLLLLSHVVFHLRLKVTYLIGSECFECNGVLTFENLAITLCTNNIDISKIIHGTRLALMCCVRTSEQTVTFTSCNVNRLFDIQTTVHCDIFL